MCLSVGMMMGLTALQGVSQIAATNQQAKAQQAYYDAQAQAAEQNADIQAKKGEQIAEQYAYEQQKLNDRRRLVAGQQASVAIWGQLLTLVIPALGLIEKTVTSF